MHRWKTLTLAAVLTLSSAVASVPATAQLQGTVAAKIEPTMLLRHLARNDEQAFLEFAEVAVHVGAELAKCTIDQELLGDSVLRGLLSPIIDGFVDRTTDRILCIRDPEQLIDLVDALGVVDQLLGPGNGNGNGDPDGSACTIDEDQLAELMDGLTGLLTGLLPEQILAIAERLISRTGGGTGGGDGSGIPGLGSIDITRLPLAGATVTVSNRLNWPLAFALVRTDGQFSVRLPRGSSRLRINAVGYTPVELTIAEAMTANGDFILEPNAGSLFGRVAGPPHRSWAGARAPVQLQTATGQPRTIANLLGWYALEDIVPLLPGPLGGIGFHMAVVDVDGYEIEREPVLFVASSAHRSFTLTPADPFGELRGRVWQRRSSLEGLNSLALSLVGVPSEVREQLFGATPLAGAMVSLESGGQTFSASTDSCGAYSIRDIPVAPGYDVLFERTSPDLERLGESGEIRPARTTDLSLCLGRGKLQGTANYLLGDVRLLRPGTSEVVDSREITAFSYGNLVEWLVTPGTYDVQFRRTRLTGTTVEGTLPGFEVGYCSDHTLNFPFPAN